MHGPCLISHKGSSLHYNSLIYRSYTFRHGLGEITILGLVRLASLVELHQRCRLWSMKAERLPRYPPIYHNETTCN